MREKDYVEILRPDDAELRPPVRSPVRSREGQTESPSSIEQASIEQGKDIAAGKGARLMRVENSTLTPPTNRRTPPIPNNPLASPHVWVIHPKNQIPSSEVSIATEV